MPLLLMIPQPTPPQRHVELQSMPAVEINAFQKFKRSRGRLAAAAAVDMSSPPRGGGGARYHQPTLTSKDDVWMTRKSILMATLA